MVKKLLLSVFTLLCYLFTSAQQPVLNVKGRDSSRVKLQQLDIDVKVTGNIATTTMTMRFCSNATRVLEGELVFPMPEGVSISRFALDINGHMREAVPVEKEKGQVVFETIERRNVDPGLLEQTEGNNFRTRIYPIPANGCRTVIIAYEQELHQAQKNAMQYSLPLHFKYPINNFSIAFNVYAALQPEIGSDCGTGLRFDSLKNVFQATVRKTDFAPNGSFQLMMPVFGKQATAMMQQVNGQYYFLINSFPEVQTQPKKMPGEITVLWDVSLSGRLRDRQKEFALLEKYLAQAPGMRVHLYTLGLTVQRAGEFNSWPVLRKALEELVYDGATNISVMPQQLPGGECLFFTDGLNTWGRPQQTRFSASAVYTISAAAQADFEYLRMIAAQTGGVMINLNEKTTEEALQALLQLPLQLLQVNSGSEVSEVYPSIAMPVMGNCAVTGISSNPKTTVTLQYGYGSTVSYTQTVELDFAKMEVTAAPISRIWAQKKIAQLNMQYEVFKPLITELGKKYGIVTRNTSLIVLDDVADYVRYEIEPPAELKAEYTRLMNEKKETEKKTNAKTVDDAVAVYDEVSAWWEQKFEVVKKPEPVSVVADTGMVAVDTAALPAPQPIINRINYNTRVGRGAITGRVTDANGEPLPGASVVIKGTRSGAVTNNEGKFRINRTPGRRVKLAITYVGYQGAELYIPANRNYLDIALNQSNTTLSEVVVVGYGTSAARMEYNNAVTVVSTDSARSSVTYFASAAPQTSGGFEYNRIQGNDDRRAVNSEAVTLRASRPLQERARRTTAQEEMQRIPGVQLDSAAFKVADGLKDKSGEMTLLNFSPDRDYLKQLDSLNGGDRYRKYLELRKNYENIPSFYFDMGNYFLQKGDTLTGIKILSGIADLGIEDHELFKMLGYKLKNLGLYAEEVNVFRKVLNWRPQEPQSYRDYGLALADEGKYQQAYDTLYTALLKNYNSEIARLYPGIEEIIVTEMNNLVAVHPLQVGTRKLPAKATKNMDVDVRVVLNWNMSDSDIDLWVIDPNGEKCFYSHRLTEIGGRISRDFTQGYGPEQFMARKALSGTYKVMLHYYGDRQQKVAGAATIMAEIYTNYGKPNQERKIITLQMDKDENREGIPVAEFSF